MNIVTLVNNSMAFDVRVQRHARALAEAGHQVVSIGVLNQRDRHRPGLARVEGLRYGWVDRRRRGGPRSRLSWTTSTISRLASHVAWQSGLRIDAIAHRIVAPSYSLLLREALRQDADLYYANDIDTLSVGIVAAHTRRVRLVYDAHEYYLGEGDVMDPQIVAARDRVERLGLSRADACITVSDGISKQLSTVYACTPPAVVRNLPEIASDVRITPVPVDPEPVRVLYHTGNLALNGRHVKDLIDAAAVLNGRVFLTLRGHLTPPREAELLAYLKGRLEPGTWAVLPVVPYDELMRAASHQDIGVVLNATTNINERLTLPNKPFEYMMAGLAVLSYRTSGVAEILEREGVGEVTPENTARALADGLRRLMANRDVLMRTKEHARQVALETYNWSREKRRLLDVIDRVAGASRTTRLSIAS